MNPSSGQTWSLSAYWFGRRESFESIGARLLGSLEVLRRYGVPYEVWAESDDDVHLSEATVVEVLERSVNRDEFTGEPIEGLGTVVVLTPADGPQRVTIWVNAGNYDTVV